jgi:hypothetical protein
VPPEGAGFDGRSGAVGKDGKEVGKAMVVEEEEEEEEEEDDEEEDEGVGENRLARRAFRARWAFRSDANSAFRWVICFLSFSTVPLRTGSVLYSMARFTRFPSFEIIQLDACFPFLRSLMRSLSAVSSLVSIRRRKAPSSLGLTSMLS